MQPAASGRSIRLSRPLLSLALIGLFAAAPAGAQAPTEGEALYRVLLLRAAPGEFDALLSALRETEAIHAEAGDAAPFRLRHSQGDHWDFMLIQPMESFAAWHAPARAERRRAAWASSGGRALAARLERSTSYREEWLAASVPTAEMQRRFEGMGLYHIEMFAGLPGKRAELIEQRRMENRYYRHLGRQENLIFTRAGGSNWDAMTIGYHPDLQAFAAAGARYSDAEQDEAARAAGFDGVDRIGPYLRSLLAYHNDTLAVPAN